MRASDYWQDIGTLEQCQQSQRDVLDGKAQGIRSPGTCVRKNIYVGQRTQVNDRALEGLVVMGENARIDPKAYLGPYTVIGSNTVVWRQVYL